MSKLIRFDEDHFGYLSHIPISRVQAEELHIRFGLAWPGKQLLVMLADEFIDLTGKYEIVPIPEAMASE